MRAEQAPHGYIVRDPTPRRYEKEASVQRIIQRDGRRADQDLAGHRAGTVGGVCVALRAPVQTEPANERTGTATAWIETPDLSKKNKLALSSLFLTDGMPTGIQEPASNNGHGEKPAPSRLLQGIRYYKSGQPIVYFFRLYNALNDKAETDATMQIEIMQDEKPILTTPWQPAATLQLKKDAKGLAIGGQLGLRNVKPSIYDLRVSVKGPKGNTRSGATADFSISL
jgi:hypothetical protein